MELAQDKDRWRALVGMVRNLQVLKMRGIFWLAAEPVSFSRRILLHGASNLCVSHDARNKSDVHKGQASVPHTYHNLLFCHQTPFLEPPEYRSQCGKLLNHAETAHMISLLLQSAWRNILISVWHIYLVCYFIEYGPNISFLSRSHCTSHAKLHIIKTNFLD